MTFDDRGQIQNVQNSADLVIFNFIFATEYLCLHVKS